MTACSLVQSTIIHVRHGTPSHRLERKGLSIWVDLDDLEQADQQSLFFSVGRFNLMSFHEQDYGCNFKSKKPLTPLAQYARDLARDIDPDLVIDRVRLLTFPRLLGVSFNPISVYLCQAGGRDVLAIYEVRNTFGDMHSYVGQITGDAPVTHQVEKHLHVSPFFSMEGGYRLKLKTTDQLMRLLIHYYHQNNPRLTATLRGDITPLNSKSLLRAVWGTGQFPLRPLVAIHWEAVKLWLKNVQFFGRPVPLSRPWTQAKVNMAKINMTRIKGNKPS